MAHSDIFLCGHSNDAILATKVYSIIKEKKGVVKSFFLEQLSRKHPHILGQALHTAKTRDVSVQQPSSGGEKCIQLKPRMDSNRLAKTNTNLRGNYKDSSLFLLLLSSPFTLLFSLPYDSTFLPGPGESHFPFSRMNIHKHYHHTEHSGLVCGRLLVLAGTFLYRFNSTSEDNGFIEGIIYLFNGPTRIVRVIFPPGI